MSWIKVEIGLKDKPEVVRMASALKADEDTIVGKLICLWGWANANSEDGSFLMPADWIDRFLGVPGFYQAMVSVGWLEVSEQGFAFPSYDRHNSSSAKRRALDAERKRVVRNVSALKADETRTREDKRRTDKTERSVGSVSVSVAGSNALAASTHKGRNPKSIFRAAEKIFASPDFTPALRSWFNWQLNPPDGMKPAFTAGEWRECALIAEQAANGHEPHKLFAKLAGSKDRAGVLQKIPETIRTRSKDRLAKAQEVP